jgi:hypothetical protein
MACEIFTRLGRLVKVENIKTKAFSNESVSYISVWVKDADGSNPRCLLFTENELAKAEARAFKNEEDLTERSWISKLLD